MGFDELNVMTETDSLYDDMKIDTVQELERLYLERYLEVMRFLKATLPKHDIIDDLVAMWIVGLLNDPDPVTHYAFEPELVRKRDRAKEAIRAVPTRTQKQLELEKAGRYALQQIGFYVDIAEDRASLQALKDAGVERVRWNAYGDDRVCAGCESLDGNVYPIERVPDKLHPRCRCFLTPA